MKCPKCESAMEKVKYQEIEVDRCTNCKGIWFDMLEHEHLRAIEGSESIDIGKRKVGKKYNKVDKINCPVCKTRMIRMVDSQQPHIWFEGCSVCYGVYFDAGEFKDYKEDNIFDFFKDLFKKNRGSK